MLGVLELLCQFWGKWSMPSRAMPWHIIVVEIESRREVGIGGLQMHVHQVVDSTFHCGGIILTNLRAHD